MSAATSPRSLRKLRATSRPSRSRTTRAVRTGDVLFRIDDRDYRAKLAQASANVEAAQARLTNVDADIQLQHALIRQAEAQKRSNMAEMTLATKASDRRRELIRTSAVSQASVDESDAALARAEAGVSAASATVEAQRQRVAVLATQREAAVAALAQARAARDLAQIDLDHTVVHAPVDGVIGNRQVRVGRLVAPGAALLDIVPVNDVWVVANFKETQIEHIRPGQRVRITVDGYPNQTLEGVVDSFAPGSGSAFSLLPVGQCDRKLHSRRSARAGKNPVCRQSIARPHRARPVRAGRDRSGERLMSAVVAVTPDRDRPATGYLLVAGVVLATLTEAIAGTVLALGRSYISGDAHAAPDESAWLDIGYTSLKLIGFMVAPWLMTRINPHRLIIGATLVMGTACGIAAITTRLDLLIALRVIQGFSGGALLVGGQAIIFLAYPLSRQPILQALFAMGSVVAPGDHRPRSAGLVDRQPILDMDFLQRCSDCAGGCRTAVDRGRPEARYDHAPSV